MHNFIIRIIKLIVFENFLIPNFLWFTSSSQDCVMGSIQDYLTFNTIFQGWLLVVSSIRLSAALSFCAAFLFHKNDDNITSSHFKPC